MNEYEIKLSIKPRNTGKYHESTTKFAINLKHYLKKKIKGEVWCHLVDDTLVVDIYGVNSIVYRYTREDMATQIVQGLYSEMLGELIYKRYRRYIENLFFM